MSATSHGAGLVALCAIGCAVSHPHDGRIEADVALYEEIFAARCERAVSCERGDWYGGSMLTEYACDPAVLAAGTAAFQRGEAHVDEEAARVCLEGLRAPATCTVMRTRFASGFRHPARTRWLDELEVACDRVLTRSPAPCGGDLCAAGDRCGTDASGPHCLGLASVGESCALVGCRAPGECRGPVEDDSVCTVDCVTFGLSVCIAQGVGDQCTGTGLDCAPAPAVGEPCAPLADGTFTCEIEAVCDLDTGLCRAPAGMGDACDPTTRTSVCASPLACDDELRTCRSNRMLPCATGYGRCDPGEYCHQDGTCSGEPEGGECTSYYWWSSGAVFAWLDSCPVGYACDSRSSFRDGPWARCRPIVPAGGACTTTSACVEGTACREGTCAPVIPPFGPCDDATDCRDGWACDAGRCVAPARP